MATFDQVRQRFLAGFATRANLDPAHFNLPGTTLVAREDRTGTGIVTCYWAGRHAVVWLDPDLMDRLAGVAHPSATVAAAELDVALIEAGFAHAATADMRVLGDELGTVFDVSTPQPYKLEQLDSDAPQTLAAVREFAERCDPDDVEEAALDDLDNFDERAIHVLTIESAVNDSQIVAYASACDWEWDDGFTDIGVLVDRAHRGLGLGRCVVANAVRQLLREGRLPLYRHDQANAGSQALAVGCGFRPAVTLAFYRPSVAGSSSSQPDE